MEKKQQIIENFKSAIKSTARSVSNIENLEVNFGSKTDQYKNLITIPEINDLSELEVTKTSSLVDFNNIKQIVEKNSASFAFPSQSIYVEKK